MRVWTDRRCLEHRVPPGFPEAPERLEKLLETLSASVFEVVSPDGDPAWLEAVAAVHDGAYLKRFERAVARGDGLLDSADNPLSAGTWEASRAAVEVVLAALPTVVTGESAFAAVRPPGHHAERSFAMGFCYFNVISVAAQAMIDRHGLERLAIFDFDVHHGNGTQHLFSSRSDVLYVSVHQFPFYPGTGAADERGVGEGVGTTLNLPLPAGCGDEVYLSLLRDSVLPALEDFGPDALLLSAGFDAWEQDPLGGMKVSVAGYREYGRVLGDLADRCCGGRLLGVLEGGYDLAALPRLVEAHLDGLSGKA